MSESRKPQQRGAQQTGPSSTEQQAATAHRPVEPRTAAQPAVSPKLQKPIELFQKEGDGAANRPLVIVGIGGSAGALDGYERFFLSLPPGSGMAFVVVSHLGPRHRGLMPEMLQRCTVMPVVQVEDGMAVQPDHVYVAVPGQSLSISKAVLLLNDLEPIAGRVIDTFFEALANDQGEHAVGVILSGTGDDGTRGIQAIEQQSGLVLVQDPASANYPSMPRQAAATQQADAVLPAEDLAPRLYSFMTRARSLHPQDLMGEDGQASVPLQKLLRLVQMRTGHDVSRYKRSMLVRRIDRRMKMHRIQAVSDYLKLLQDSQDEVDTLFRDFTINVTSFFRDIDAFDELKAQLRSMVTHNGPLEKLRVWVAGCSTGEEAYSVAIVLHELAEELRGGRALKKVQLFATDTDGAALDQARSGLYSRDISYVVSPARLERYFQPRGNGYQVRPELRNMVVFAQHNTLDDPPFTRLDLLCCRNLLIDLGPNLQAQVMSVFQSALRPGGLLFLGASETAETGDGAFIALNAPWKIYGRSEEAAPPLPVGHSPGSSEQAVANRWSPEAPRPSTLMQQAQATLLAHYTPPSVVIDASGEMVLVNGPTGQYLELPLSKTLTNVFEVARGGLNYELRSAVQQALAEQNEVVRPYLSVETGQQAQWLDVIVRPLPGALPQPHLLVLFRERTDLSAPPPEKTGRILRLENELQRSRESQQTSTEDMAVAFEELKSTHNALQNSIEELQSNNEKMSASRAGLQALNEQLVTINAEHQRVISELRQTNNDLQNWLNSAGVAMVLVGRDLTIRRFTPDITRVIHLTAEDLGRLISDVNLNLKYEHLTREISGVLETLDILERQVQTHAGQWYLMRISPYRTADNAVDGVVVALT